MYFAFYRRLSFVITLLYSVTAYVSFNSSLPHLGWVLVVVVEVGGEVVEVVVEVIGEVGEAAVLLLLEPPAG